MTEEQMATLIGAALQEDGMSQAEFCRRVGVSAKHLNTVLRGHATARAATLDYWAFVLGRHFEVFLDVGREPREPAEVKG